MSDVDATPVPDGYASSSGGGYKVVSNAESAEQLAEIVTPEQDPVKEAAKTLGEKGGKASAEAKAAKVDAPEPPATEDGAPAGAEPAEKLGKPRDDPKARMLEATRKEAEAKRERDAARREAQQLHERLAALERDRAQPPQPTAPPKPADEDPEPKEEDYDNYGTYAKDAARWAARQEWKKAQETSAIRNQARQYAETVKRTVDSFHERVSKAKAADPELVSKLSPEVAELRPSFDYEPGEPRHPQKTFIADRLLTSPHVTDYLLYFSAHDDELQRIAALQSPYEIVEELAIIKSQFGRQDAVTAGTSVKPRVSSASPPVRPVTGSPGATDTEPGPDASYAEHKRYWANREKAAGRR